VARWKITVIDKFQETILNIMYGYRCNFSCEGCCTGSNYIKNNSYDPDINKTIEILPALANLVDIADTGMITLLGGDIFMYWPDQIIPLTLAIRKHFPNASINLFTNGQLLNKYTDEIIDLMTTIDNCKLTISQHLIGDLETALGQAWTRNVSQFLNDSRIWKIHNDHYHIKGYLDCNIHFYNGIDWFTWYKQEADGRIKPHVSQDPVRSMQYGCASGPLCSTIFETNLYKCSSLATLDGLLSLKGQKDDPDWQDYLNYPHVDLNNFDLENFEYHKKNHGKPVAYCDMCSASPRNIIKWMDRKQNMVLPATK